MCHYLSSCLLGGFLRILLLCIIGEFHVIENYKIIYLKNSCVFRGLLYPASVDVVEGRDRRKLVALLGEIFF